MGHSDWENDSDYRIFSPGKYAMRQLGRSVSRKARQVLQTPQPAGQQQHHQQTQGPFNDGNISPFDADARSAGGSNAMAANGYLAYEFADGSGAGTFGYRRGPPMPSGIHRRSVSFDNIVVLPDSMPRRSTEPPPSLAQPDIADLRLPSASTWNSGTATTKSALPPTDSPSNETGRPRGSSMRRRWLAGLAHPLSTAIDSEYHAQSMTGNGAGQSSVPSAVPSSSRILGHITRVLHAGGGSENTGGPIRRKHHNRESFSGPAQLDVVTNASDSPRSTPNNSGHLYNNDLWVGEDIRGPISGQQYLDTRYAAEDGSAPHVTFQQQNRPQNGHVISPSIPVSSGLFRRSSDRKNAKTPTREPSQRKRGNIARVIGTISRRLTRIRSNRSASQPATAAEVRQSIIDSARNNMLLIPNETGHDFYRFLVNPAEPVSDCDSSRADSPTILRQRPPQRGKTHRRNPTFPSQTFDEFKESIMGDGNALAMAERGSSHHSVSSVHLPDKTTESFASAAAPMNDSLAMLYRSLKRGLPETISVAIEPSAPANVNTSSDSAYTAPEHNMSSLLAAGGHETPSNRLTNQGHDGSISRIVQDKLESDFIGRVRVSTRLNKDVSPESSYGSFVRFHDSGELNNIFDAREKEENQIQSAPATSNDSSLLEPHSAVVAAEALMTEAEPVPNSYMRNQDNIKRFVEEVRAARSDSDRRKQEADIQRQVMLNHQAALDAAVYIYERQRKQQHQMQRQHQQNTEDSPPSGSVSSVEVGGCGAGALASVLPSRKAKDKARGRRRQSEAPGSRIRPVRDSDGRRRATVFGVFCGASDSVSTLSINDAGSRPVEAASTRSRPPPVPSKGASVARVIKRGRRRKAPSSAYVNKDLPPLPNVRPIAPEPVSSDSSESGPESESDSESQLKHDPEQETFSIPVIDGTRSPLQRSRSFSHFGSSPRIAVPERRWTRSEIPAPWTQDPAALAVAASAGQVPAPAPAPAQLDQEQMPSRGGFFAGVLSKLTSSSSSRRKSGGVSSVASTPKSAMDASDIPFGGRRKLVRNSNHQRRHTLASIEAPADHTPPSVILQTTGAPLSAEVYAGIAVSAAENAQSSGSRRMYSEMLQSLRDDALPARAESDVSDDRMLGKYTRNGWTDSEPSRSRETSAASLTNSHASLSNSHGSKLASGSTGNSASVLASLPALTARPTASNGDGDGWRDSAITGMLTQVSATTPSNAKATFGDVATMPPMQAQPGAKRISDPRGLGIQVQSHVQPNTPVLSVSSIRADPADRTPELQRHAVRFLPQNIGGPTRTSSVAMDTITARGRIGELRHSGRQARGRGAQSMPHSHEASRVVSSDGSFTDMLANANSDYMRDYPMLDMSDLDNYSPGIVDMDDASLPFPANEKLRQLENAVLFGGLRIQPGAADSMQHGRPMDSPTSEAGTGRTQILDFAEADMREGAQPGTRYRRPSARPEIKDVRGILWAADPTPATNATATAIATAAASAELATGTTAAREIDASESPATLNNLERLSVEISPGAQPASDKAPAKFATIAALDQASLQLLLETGKLPDVDQHGEGSPATVNPVLLTRLVHTSPDPRNLIYDAGSQFGSMRSRASPGSEKAAAELPSPTPVVPAIPQPAVLNIATVSAPDHALKDAKIAATDDSAALKMLGSQSKDITSTANPQDNESFDEQNVRTPRNASRNMSTFIDSDVLARASVQALMAGESPAMAVRKLSNRALAAAALESGKISTSAGAAANSSNSASRSNSQNDPAAGPENRRMSLQEYVEQQRLPATGRAMHAGHEQLNFRVSLLDRKPPRFNKKSRSASLPPLQSMLPVLGTAAVDPAGTSARSLFDRSAYIPRPGAHQRTRSFYDSPPLVQALLNPDISSPDSQMPPWPAGSSRLGDSSIAGEELVERALFSHLLGDGAALTSPDIRVARKQSVASTVLPSNTTQLFDPEVDTGEDGVPEPVLRAYLAGDLTAIERFFEHIMRITAPSSVFDGEVSEDGDWAYGLEGPPPEVIAQREADAAAAAAATAEAGQSKNSQSTSDSREVPGMMDNSAEESRIIGPGMQVSRMPSANSSRAFARTPGPHAPSSVDASAERAAPEGLDIPVPRSVDVADPARPDTHHESYSTRQAVASSPPEVGSGSEVDVPKTPSRPIAIAHSRLSRIQRSASKESPQTSASTSRNVSSGSYTSPTTSVGTPQPHLKSNTSTSVANSQAQHIARHASGYPVSRSANSPERQPTVVSRNPKAPVSRESPLHRQSHAESALCFSPGRMRDHNRNSRQFETSQRKPILNTTDISRSQEKRILMTRLRVLEGMIQRTAIEESRLQPPEVLRRQRLVEDMESMASIYSSSMELDYDRIHQELSNKAARDIGDGRHYQKDDGSPRRMSSNRGNVLGRLKSGSQARALSPLRASIYDRQFAANGSSTDKSSTGLSERHHRSTAAQAGSAPMGLPSAGAPNMSLVSGLTDVAYSARASGSIRIDIVDESVSSASGGGGGGGGVHVQQTVMPSGRRAPVPFSRSGRFQRTAKLLS
ncbi:hypothetical protein LPJ53_003048 [Coemansia erecta]|uniref:Uncharacterized protein n=1 Tax=Coemansia erecta TaxID=147472 RepID=A0A9W7XX12_9FUNG|nr:hypothetical protein LPJ53_003048 [Coemansia erecta]